MTQEQFRILSTRYVFISIEISFCIMRPKDKKSCAGDDAENLENWNSRGPDWQPANSLTQTESEQCLQK